MNPFRFVRVLGPLAVAGLLALGCQAPQTGAENEETEQADDALSSADQPGAPDPAAPQRGKHRGERGHHGGPHALFKAALELPDLSAGQRSTIEGLLPKDEKNDAPRAAPAELKAYFSSLAESVRAGHVDAEKLSVDAAKLSPARPDRHAEFAKKLQTLHAALTPAQRATLVADVADEMAPRGEMHGKRPHGPRDQDGERAKPDHGRMGPLGMMLHGIDISDAQRATIGEALEKAGLAVDKHEMEGNRDAMKAGMEAMMKAFASESFDAASVLPEPPEASRDHLAEMVARLAVVVPLLDETQRSQLADRLQDGPMKKRFDKPGRGIKRDRASQSQ